MRMLSDFITDEIYKSPHCVSFIINRPNFFWFECAHLCLRSSHQKRPERELRPFCVCFSPGAIGSRLRCCTSDGGSEGRSPLPSAVLGSLFLLATERGPRTRIFKPCKSRGIHGEWRGCARGISSKCPRRRCTAERMVATPQASIGK